MRVKGLTGPQADSVHRIRGLMAPQAALDSAAAARRQVHMNDIASVTPRLVTRKPPPLDKNRLWLNFTAGCPATAVRFGNRPAPSVGRHLTGQKGLGQPLRTRPLAVFAVRRTAANCDWPPANCGLRSYLFSSPTQ